MGLALETVPYLDNGGGLDLTSSPTKTLEDHSTLATNIDYTIDGSIRSRNGSQQLNLGSQIPGAPMTIGLFDFRRSDGVEREIIAAGDDLYLDLETPVAQGFTLDDEAYPDFEYFANQNDEYAFYGNGVDTNLKYNGTTWTNWSIVGPVAAPVAADNGAGVLPVGDYTYYTTFANYDAVNDVVIQESPLSPESNTLTIIANRKILVSLAVSADPQVNARIIYRKDPDSASIFFRVTVVPNNVDISYDDNNPTNTANPRADHDNANAPLTAIFAEYNGRMYMVDAERKTDLYYSELGDPWNVSIDNLEILDGEITTLHRFFGTLIIGTDRSLWVLTGDADSLENPLSLKRISSKIGVFNNRCIAGESILYFLSTTLKVYALRPTDLTQDEIRIDFPISDDVTPELNSISISLKERTCLEYFTTAESSKVYITYNIGAGNNQNMVVYNESQSIRKEAPVWQTWNHMEPSVIKQFLTNSQNRLIFGDFNGFLWKMEDPNIDGDGAEINGTATSGTNNTLTQSDLVDESGTATAGGAATLTDATQAWIVNEWQADQIYIFAGTGSGQTRIVQSNTPTVITVTVAWGVVPDATSQYYIGGLVVNGHVGQKITIIGGTGEDQVRTITANTPVTVTVSSNWAANPDATSEYTIGGYETFHFSNWKYVLENYDVLKQLWFIWINANANGDYTIQLIIQIDFDTTITNQTTLLVNLSALNSIWGQFLWGQGIWGSRSVFQDRFRTFQRFRAIRIGFRHLKAGQPWQVNSFSLSCQNKKLFFSGAP